VTAPDDVDPVLWQQAVEAGQSAAVESWPTDSVYVPDWHPADRELHRGVQWESNAAASRAVLEQRQFRVVAAVLSASFGVLQQAIRQQIADDIVRTLQGNSTGLLSPSKEMYDLGLLDARAVVLQRCPTSCDDDCEQPCHEVHQVRYKWTHNPDHCPGVARGETPA